MVRGTSAEALAAEFGGKISARSLGRRMRELKGKADSARSDARKSSAPVVDTLPEADAVPENTHLEQLDGWLKRAEREARAAETRGDIETLAKMVRLAGTLLEQKRKATPPPKRDPDENPDMITAARRAREKLHKLIESADA
jgi:hypothetical protein